MTSTRTTTPTELEAFMDAAAPLAGLTIDPANRSAVAGSLDMAAGMARLVLSFPLDDVRDEPAAVFRAGEGA